MTPPGSTADAEDFGVLSYTKSVDSHYRDARRREPSCDHIQAPANAGVVRRRARELIAFLDGPRDWTYHGGRQLWLDTLSPLVEDVRTALGDAK